jgi:hypothetical protein
MTAVIALLLALFNDYLPKFLGTFINAHPWIFGFCVAWLIVTIMLFFRAYSLGKYKALAARLGAVYAENMGKGRLSYDRRAEIVEHHQKSFLDSEKLYILGATGLRTFVQQKDPVQDAGAPAILRPVFDLLVNDKQRSSKINVDILLIHPDSRFVKERAPLLLDPKQTIEEYQLEIRKAIDHCVTLKKDLPKLRCFLYDRPPIWKLILTDEFVWQQFYKDGIHVEHSRINIFKNTAKERQADNALYTPFLKLFELLRDSACQELDLTKGLVPPLDK